MSKVPFIRVKDWQQAQEIHPDRPVVLVRVYTLGVYLRYHREFYHVDTGPYGVSGGAWQWRIAGVWFNPDSMSWMLDNSIACPFSSDDLMLYQLTWGDIRE